MQLRVRIGAVAVARAPRTKHHVAAVHGALVHLAQMHRREVDLQRALVTERLHAHVTLHPLLAVRRHQNALLAQVRTPPLIIARTRLRAHVRIVVVAVGRAGACHRVIVAVVAEAVLLQILHLLVAHALIVRVLLVQLLLAIGPIERLLLGFQRLVGLLFIGLPCRRFHARLPTQLLGLFAA